jgi:hypothetical protein
MTLAIGRTRRLRDDAGRQPHGIVGQRSDQPAMRQAPGIAVRLADLHRKLQGAVGASGIDRLPRGGHRTVAVVRHIAGRGSVGGRHGLPVGC